MTGNQQSDLLSWAVQMVAENSTLLKLHDTAMICRLASALVDFVQSGKQPAPETPPVASRH